MEAAPDPHAVYNTKPIILMPGESHMAVTLEQMFPDIVVPIEVKKAVRHLCEVFESINAPQLQLELNATQLPLLKTRYTLMSWMFSTMSAKCYCKKTDGKHEQLYKIATVIINACDANMTTCEIGGKPVTKIAGINLVHVCSMFGKTVDEDDMSDLESVNSDLAELSIDEMGEKIAQHVKDKSKLTRRARNTQNLINATQRAITKRKHSETMGFAKKLLALPSVTSQPLRSLRQVLILDRESLKVLIPPVPM